MGGFTSVLKKIGTVLLDAGQIATQVLGFPFISDLLGGIKLGGSTAGSVVSTVVSDLGSVASIVSMAEAMFPGTGTGSQKLAAASPLVQQALLTWATSNLPGHSKVKDPQLLAKAAGEITGGFADFLNALGQ